MQKITAYYKRRLSDPHGFGICLFVSIFLVFRGGQIFIHLHIYKQTILCTHQHNRKKEKKNDRASLFACTSLIAISAFEPFVA